MLPRMFPIIRAEHNCSFIFTPLELSLSLTGTIVPPSISQVCYVRRCCYVYNRLTIILDAWFAGGSDPVPDSGLVNGVGRYNGGPQTPWARINVSCGKRYRFRLISLSASGWVTSFLQIQSQCPQTNH